MNWFKFIIDAVRAARSLYISLKPCVCGEHTGKIGRTRSRDYYVYCTSCRIKTTSYNRRWKAKLAWNRDMGGR